MYHPSPVFVILAMLFCHVLDDFFIQSVGFLVRGKQKSWWEKEAPDKMYKHDYIVCLFMHAASWSFSIMLPIAWYYDFAISDVFMQLWISNTVIHMLVDDLKANRNMLNLVQDQFIHLLQIICTFIILMAL